MFPPWLPVETKLWKSQRGFSDTTTTIPTHPHRPGQAVEWGRAGTREEKLCSNESQVWEKKETKWEQEQGRDCGS